MLGYGLGVAIRIRPAPRQLVQVAELARQTPEVVECQRVTGDDCYLITAYVRDVEHLEAVIDEFAAYGQTTSSVMQSSPVPRRGLAPLGPR
jgi:Lrp/AsnC family leucine-responsive transcriptional regulator